MVFEMRNAILAAGVMPTAHDKLVMAQKPWKRVVSFVRFYGGNVKLMDTGNFIGGLKACLDELKLVTWTTTAHGQKVERPGFGFLYDDSPAFVCDMYDQRRDLERAGQLEITIR